MEPIKEEEEEKIVEKFETLKLCSEMDSNDTDKLIEAIETIKNEWLDLIEKITNKCLEILKKRKGFEESRKNCSDDDEYTLKEMEDGLHLKDQYDEGQISFAMEVSEEISAFLLKMNVNNQVVDEIKKNNVV